MVVIGWLPQESTTPVTLSEKDPPPASALNAAFSKTFVASADSTQVPVAAS